MVIAVDPNSDKHGLALRAGADAVTTPEGAAALVAELVPGGVDLAVEAVGNANVMSACLEMLVRCGAVVSVGCPHPLQQLVVPALQFAGSGKRLLDSYVGSTAAFEDINDVLDALAEGRVVDSSHRTEARACTVRGWMLTTRTCGPAGSAS
ncbi:zinc-binding dehydrogenase [Pseudoclavibacter terrae]